MKAYIASEDRGIETSAGLVRRKFTEAIEKGRAYGRDGNKNDLYEALRLLGTGLHCLEGSFTLFRIFFLNKVELMGYICRLLSSLELR